MEDGSETGYSAFWEDVGANFPSLKGAASTAYYLDCERTLLQTFSPTLAGKSVFKTDLWDEAKNTEILRWAASQGARPFGIDISFATARQASALVWNDAPGIALGDVRCVPFRSDSFDLIYSMGTIEHFPDYDIAAAEIFRVLKPGGTAIIGVPNKLDPFLRPAMVTALNVAGLYGYGREKSFTPWELRHLLESVGFRITGISGILFIPGWLRMLDLLLHTRVAWLEWLTRGPVRFFASLYHQFPALRRHGYLMACIAIKPSES
ncbi:MAG: methyltransferase domain-containing protein [Chloroflexi bacterium]|nr:methyltransferase domain-containing protein [Chloroflexota bacterium]